MFFNERSTEAIIKERTNGSNGDPSLSNLPVNFSSNNNISPDRRNRDIYNTSSTDFTRT